MDGAGARRLRIAYLNYGPQSGVTANVAQALSARGHVVVPVSATGVLEPRDARTGGRRLTMPVLAHLAAATLAFGRRGLDHRWNTAYAFDAHSLEAQRRLDEVRPAPDVVLQNGALFAPGAPPRLPYVLLCDHTRALAMEIGDARGLPPLLDYGPRWRSREAAVYSGAAAICAFSRRTAASFERHYGVDPSRVQVVGAGANVLPDAPLRDDDGRTIVFVGKDFVRKGGPVLVEAFRKLRRRRPDARLLVAGPRRPLELPDGAEQLGLVPFSGLPQLLSRATVFALPTRREPFGIAFLDAMACGVPCVGTRAEAVPEIVLHGETGLLVPPGDPDALADALGELLADPERARAMGLAGRRRVESTFLWSHVAERLEAALLRAAAPAAAGRAPPLAAQT